MVLESFELERDAKGAPGAAKIAAGGLSFYAALWSLEALGIEPGSLRPGRELSEEEAGLLELAARASEAERRAALLLARAEQSSFGLRAKLLERGFPARAAALALARLEELGLLSDRRFAEAWARARLRRRAEGPASLLAELRARGIEEATAREALAAVLSPEERALALRRAAERLGPRLGAEALRRELRRLGFGSEEIRDWAEGEGSATKL